MVQDYYGNLEIAGQVVMGEQDGEFQLTVPELMFEKKD